MSLASDYKRQFAWRAWSTVFDTLPPLREQLVFDLGCGIGDQAAELIARGARVIGIDGNDDLLREARAQSLDRAEFLQADLCALPDLDALADGLWCSFTAAYFPSLSRVLESWSRHLRPGGWIALTEIDDLFGHQPLSAETKLVFDVYARDALSANRYDFHMGRKLRGYLGASGFSVSRELMLPDAELSFDGPAPLPVIDAWRKQLDRLKLLRDIAGASYDTVREDFLHCLAAREHRSTARLSCCIGVKS